MKSVLPLPLFGRVCGSRRWRMSCFVLAACGVSAGCKPGVPPTVALPPPEVTVATPESKEVPEYFEFTGTTAGLETVELRARVKGFLDKVHFQAGAYVNSGDLLFTIDQRTFKATEHKVAAALASAEARLRLAEFDYHRLRQLRERNVAAELEYAQKTSDFESAKADLELAKAQLESARLDLGFTEIRAPIRGRIGRALVDPGALVGAAEPTLLATLINDAQVYAYAELSEREMLRLLRERGARQPGENRPDVVFEMAKMDDVGYPHVGRFDYADNHVDPETGTIRLRAVFDNPRHVIVPGLFVRMRAELGRKAALLVPDVAVGFDQTGRYVLVVDDQSVVERRSVNVGPIQDGLRRVDDGLKPTDRVVINGIQRARPGARVAPRMTPAPSTAPAAAAAIGR